MLSSISFIYLLLLLSHDCETFSNIFKLLPMQRFIKISTYPTVSDCPSFQSKWCLWCRIFLHVQSIQMKLSDQLSLKCACVKYDFGRHRTMAVGWTGPKWWQMSWMGQLNVGERSNKFVQLRRLQFLISFLQWVERK